VASLEELQGQFAAVLQQQAGLSPEQSQQVAQIALKFAQDHAGELLALAGGGGGGGGGPLGGLLGGR
jgi:hypothetical protein